MVVMHQRILVRVGQTKAESAVMNTWLKKKTKQKEKKKKRELRTIALTLMVYIFKEKRNFHVLIQWFHFLLL